MEIFFCSKQREREQQVKNSMKKMALFRDKIIESTLISEDVITVDEIDRSELKALFDANDHRRLGMLT